MLPYIGSLQRRFGVAQLGINLRRTPMQRRFQPAVGWLTFRTLVMPGRESSMTDLQNPVRVS